MNKKDSQKPVTTDDLIDFAENTIFPGVEKIVKEPEDKILKSNEKIAGELKTLRQEQAAIHLSYNEVDRKVEHAQDYLEKADKKLQIGFKRA